MKQTTNIIKRMKLAIFATSLSFLSAAGLSLALLNAAAVQNPSGAYLVFGPVDFVRGTDKPRIETRHFGARLPSGDYLLRISNGGRNGEFNRVSSAQIVLNQQFIAIPRDFNQQVQIIERRVTLAADNTLQVKVASAPGSGLTIEIYGFDHEPPTINATVAPSPNAAGWNNTDVTVSFTCADQTSGIASCPPPITVATEGTNQIVTGTATDRAGNTATASPTLNIDKTPPSLALSLLADQTIVAADVITLAGTASDSLSGMDQVTCNGVPAALSGDDFSCGVGLVEGFNAINVEAGDRAGNAMSRALTVTSVVPRSIGPDGGTIEALGGRVRLMIPPGALAQVVTITIRPLPSSPGDPVGDTLFEFGPDGTRFHQPVELTLAYNPANVTQDQATSLRIAKLLPDGTLRLTPPGEVDTTNHTVTAEIRGFSSYTVTLQCGDPAAVCLSPPTPTAEYMQNRRITLAWTYAPLEPRANQVSIERAVVRGGEPCTAGTPHCVCDAEGCRLNGLQTPHDADYIQLATRSSSNTSYTDSSIAPDSAFYWYRLRWVSTLVSHPSEPVSVFVFGRLDPPPDPDSLRATPLACGGVELSWSTVSEAEGYLIERAEPGGNYEQVAVVPSPHTIFYTDTTPMSEGVTYTYRVRSLANSLMSRGNRTASAIAPPRCGGSIHIELATYAEHEQRNAAWVGVREGFGPWRRISGMGGSYGFDVTDFAGAERYSVAVVCVSSLQTEGRVLELTTDDPHSLSVTCGRAGESRDRLVAVEAQNVPANHCVTGAAGSYLASGACSPYGWGVSVFAGTYDLVTLARNSSTSVVGRIAIERDVTVAGSITSGSDLGTAAVAEPHVVSVTGASGPLATSVNLLTAGGTRALLGFGGATANYGGLPNAAQFSGDIHRASIVSTADGRSVHTYFKTPADVFVDFSSLPASLPDPEVSVTGRSPYLRIETDFQARAMALPAAVGYAIQYQHFNSATDSSRTWRVFLSGRWLAGRLQVYELPDFTSAPGWQSIWELPATATTINWVFTSHTTNGDASTFAQSLFSPLNREGRVLPHGFVRREFSVSGTVQ